MNTRSQSRMPSVINKTSTPAKTSASSSTPVSASTKSEMEGRPGARLVPWLQSILNPVLREQALGNSHSGLRNIVTMDPNEIVSSASPDLLEKAGFYLGDQFVLNITYADTTLKWYFAFCWMDPSLPPDMLFDDGLFKPDYSKYEEYCNWNPFASTGCFKNLLLRLFTDFRKYQLDLCGKCPRFELELAMMRENGISQDAYDVYTYREGARAGDVVFIFPLGSTAVADLPADLSTEGAVHERAQLKIRFTSFGDGKAHADLELSPFFIKLFGGKSLHLPAMVALMSEYVSEVREILNEQVSFVGDAYRFKRDLIISLIASFPKGSLIDYSDQEFTSVSFLLDHQDFKYSCKISLNPKFPAAPVSPLKIAFSSIYHETKEATAASRLSSKKPRQPVTSEMSMASVNPRCTVEELVQKIRDHIEDKVGEFKRHSCQNGV